MMYKLACLYQTNPEMGCSQMMSLACLYQPNPEMGCSQMVSLACSVLYNFNPQMLKWVVLLK